MPDIAITEKKYDKDARSNNIVESWRKKYFSHLNGELIELERM